MSKLLILSLIFATFTYGICQLGRFGVQATYKISTIVDMVLQWDYTESKQRIKFLLL